MAASSSNSYWENLNSKRASKQKGKFGESLRKWFLNLTPEERGRVLSFEDKGTISISISISISMYQYLYIYIYILIVLLLLLLLSEGASLLSTMYDTKRKEGDGLFFNVDDPTLVKIHKVNLHIYPSMYIYIISILFTYFHILSINLIYLSNLSTI